MMCQLNIISALLISTLCMNAALCEETGKKNPTKEIFLLKNQANTFLSRAKRWLCTDLNHECYREGCSKEEVRECGHKVNVEEYWNDYQCYKGENRYCKVECQYRRSCDMVEWSQWSHKHQITHTCKLQGRHRSFLHPEETKIERGGCKGLSVDCSSYEGRQVRLYCVCLEAICIPGSWSKWYGEVPFGECLHQVRHREYNIQGKFHGKARSCKDIKNSCILNDIERRKICSCRMARCTLSRQWSTWGGRLSQGECRNQSRFCFYDKTFVYKKQNRNCDGVSDECPPAITENRTKCSCKKALCSLTNWTNWHGDIAQGECGIQTRTQRYNKTLVYEERNDTCDGVPVDCPPNNEQNRTRCVCVHRSSCEMEEWSMWSVIIVRNNCTKKTRTKAYVISTLNLTERKNCTGLNTECIEERKETTKTICKCKFMPCQEEWSNWKDLKTNDACKEQARQSRYSANETFIFQEENCHGIQTTCPTNTTLEKKIHCDANSAVNSNLSKFKIATIILSILLGVTWLVIILVRVIKKGVQPTQPNNPDPDCELGCLNETDNSSEEA